MPSVYNVYMCIVIYYWMDFQLFMYFSTKRETLFECIYKSHYISIWNKRDNKYVCMCAWMERERERERERVALSKLKFTYLYIYMYIYITIYMYTICVYCVIYTNYWVNEERFRQNCFLFTPVL